MSPHILLDQELEALADPATPISWQVMIQKHLTEMMADQASPSKSSTTTAGASTRSLMGARRLHDQDRLEQGA